MTRVAVELGPDVIARPVGLVITSVIYAVFTVTCAVKAPGTIAQFREVFSGFGADLPPITSLVLKTAWVWGFLALPAVALAVWIAMRSHITRQQFRQMKLALRLYGLVLGIVAAVMVYALYTPILKLGSVI